jgi:hypothetical protein
VASSQRRWSSGGVRLRRRCIRHHLHACDLTMDGSVSQPPLGVFQS